MIFWIGHESFWRRIISRRFKENWFKLMSHFQAQISYWTIKSCLSKWFCCAKYCGWPAVWLHGEQVWSELSELATFTKVAKFVRPKTWNKSSSELDVLIVEPHNYKIYQVVFDVINKHQVRAISVDGRVPHLKHNFHYITIDRDYVNQVLVSYDF